MFRKKITCFSLIMLILIISIGAVTAYENTQLLSENSTNPPLNDGKTFTDIQKQIDEASDNETIELEGTYVSQGKNININKNLTITSKNGATLDGNQKSTIFNISNVDVCLKNLNIINSNSTMTAAIFSQGNLVVANCNFTNNTAFLPFNGLLPFDDEYYNQEHIAGAIVSQNNLEITNCKFVENYALKEEYEYEYFEYYYINWGGAIYSKGNLIIDRSIFKDDVDAKNNLTISNSQFSTSSVTCNVNSHIENTTFSKVGIYDKALIVKSYLEIIGCNFTENGGNAINAEGLEDSPCTVIIRNCNFINNNLKSSGDYDEEFDDESYTIFSESANVEIFNSNFENNTGSIFNNWGNTTILNSNFTKNNAYKGGSINSYNTTIFNSTFRDNKATFAGAIFSNILLLDNCNFTNNMEGAIGVDETATINGKSYTGLTYFDNSLNKIKLITATVGKLTTNYKSGENIWIKLIYTESKHPADNMDVQITIKKGKKTYYDDIYTNSKGIGYYKASNLDIGTYKIIFNDENDELPTISTTVKITKANTIIKAPKVTNKYKKSKYFQVTIKHKSTKAVVKNTYLKLKIDKKIYKVKTNSKGVAKFNTKKLKVGKHKVVISTGNNNYKMSAKSTIIIKR